MAGLHHANTTTEIEDPMAVLRNSRIGIILFCVYVTFYGSYVLINTFAPSWMEWVPFAGLNLAIISGMFLIFLAVVLAFVYGWLCSRSIASEGENSTKPSNGERS